MDYRKKIDYSPVRLPSKPEDEDRGARGCCFKFPVVASTVSADTWKNDKKLVYYKKNAAGDSVTWTLSKCGTGVVANLGVSLICPNEPLGVGYVFDWRSILLAYGVGEYSIAIVFNIAGISGGYTVGEYELFEYDIKRLNNSIRVRSLYNSFSLAADFDFTNSNAEDTIRTSGIFGFMDPNTQIDNLLDINRTVVKTTRENLKAFHLTAEPLVSEESKALVDFILLNEDGLFISDHNKTNHDYQLLDYPVVLEGTIALEYLGASRLVTLKGSFGERRKINKSYYNV